MRARGLCANTITGSKLATLIKLDLTKLCAFIAYKMLNYVIAGNIMEVPTIFVTVSRTTIRDDRA